MSNPGTGDNCASATAAMRAFDRVGRRRETDFAPARSPTCASRFEIRLKSGQP
jgi:hypothetical protein